MNTTTVQIIGRDRLLEKTRRYLNTKQNGLYLIGKKGTGKSTILNKLHAEHSEGCLISCRDSKGDILRAIIRTYSINIGTNNIARATIGIMQTAILKADSGFIFLDDCNELKPSLRTLLEPLRDIGWNLVLATSTIKKDYEKLFWGLKRFEVPPLRPDMAKDMATALIKREGLLATATEVARLSRGYPARLVHLARGEAVPLPAEERREEDEINIAPVLLLLFVFAVIIRTIGVGVEEKDLYIIGGFMMALGLLVRFFMYEARKK